MNGQVSDEIRLLKDWDREVLVVFGKDERFVKTDYLDEMNLKLWNNKVYKLDGGAHFINVEQPKAINDLLLDYAGFCLK